MPAILPARLRQQAALVAVHFDEPAAFVRSLRHLLEFYSERSYRPGQSGAPATLLPTYNVRPQVLRQVLVELAPFSRANPAEALLLCDALWEQDYYEFRHLAISLLGQVACYPVTPMIERARAWLAPGVESTLADHLVRQGLRFVYINDQNVMAALITDMLNSKGLFFQQMGLKLLAPLIGEPGFENIPLCYRLVQPLVRVTPPALRPEILDILARLAHHSPQETVYFLRQNLALPDNQDTAWLVRHSLDEFPVDFREPLRELARDAREKNEKNRKAPKSESGLP